MSALELSVIIPLFNEEENVALLQKEVADALKGREYELVLVDDGSTDSTASRVTVSSGVRLLRFEQNCGQSAAMLAGVRAARGKVIVLLDGDLQNDPADIPRLLEVLASGFDLVCGYRARRRDTLSKRLASRLANFVRSRFTGDGVRDTGCALKAMRAECAGALFPFNGVHRFIPSLIKNAGFRVTEIPVNHRARRFGSSKYGISDRALRATLDMLGVRWLQSRSISTTPPKEITAEV